MISASPNTPLEVVLFDLGGVLFEWDGIGAVVDLSAGRFTREEARLFWVHSRAVKEFESGRTAPDEFARLAVGELGLDLTTDDFLRAFVSWDRGPYPGGPELVRSLRGRVRTACLSNTNELHWPRIRDHWGFGALFDHAYVSHEIGHAKPAAAAYEHVARDLDVAPESILFLDDNPECVDGANAVGLVGRVARGVEEARLALVELGVLPSD